jgi:hypothetical protein
MYLGHWKRSFGLVERVFVVFLLVSSFAKDCRDKIMERGGF